MLLISRLAIALTLAILSTPGFTSTQVLQINTHGDIFIAPAINAALGPGHVDTDIFVDTTNTLSYSFQDISDAMLTGVAPGGPGYVSVATGNASNHAPYPVAGYSVCAQSSSAELASYANFVSRGQLVTWAVGRTQCPNIFPSGTQPGVVVSTASASNSGNGGTAPGLEFAFLANYLGLNTTTDSWITAALAGFYISMEFQHLTWNLFDIKGAFRQSAGNWSTGYNEANFGYGTLDYFAATAISSPAVLWLQPPGLVIENHFGYAKISLMPFLQTRRHHEVVYSVPRSYVWPVKNEYTLSDITASGGTLLYTSNGTDVIPQFVYAAAISGTITFAAFTADGAGAYSRAESFTDQSTNFMVQTSCVP